MIKSLCCVYESMCVRMCVCACVCVYVRAYVRFRMYDVNNMYVR